MWNQFWLKSIDARQYAALRIAFGGLSVVYLLGLLPYVEAQFSGLGWLRDIQQIAVQNGGSWSLFFIQAGAQATTLAYAIVWMGIIAAFMLMIGWQSRLAAFITWLVWLSLWNRNPLLLDGDDAILKLMCFYLMLSSCGNCWSVDACLQIKPQQVSVWPLRLIQFPIMQYVLIHPQYSRWDGWSFIDNPLLSGVLVALAGFIRWWELLFPFLLINAHSRKISLLIGILFHAGLLLTMNLRWFPVIMLSLYLALLSNCSFIRLEEKLLNHYRDNQKNK